MNDIVYEVCPDYHTQIDYVGDPSWQAQLSGTKTWTLSPPNECSDVCSMFNITVHRGDISESHCWSESSTIIDRDYTVLEGRKYIALKPWVQYNLRIESSNQILALCHIAHRLQLICSIHVL